METISSIIEVRSMSIEQLVPAPYNPRQVLRPGEPAYRKLEASLREFGLVEPLIWNRQTGHVVGGHARLAILKSLGVRELSVTVVDLSQAREKALNVVLNNQEAQGRYDVARLRDLLGELAELPELPMTGFDLDDLPALSFEPTGPVTPEPPVDRLIVTLEMSTAQYAQAEPRLNQLIADLDLISHVRTDAKKQPKEQRLN